MIYNYSYNKFIYLHLCTFVIVFSIPFKSLNRMNEHLLALTCLFIFLFDLGNSKATIFKAFGVIVHEYYQNIRKHLNETLSLFHNYMFVTHTILNIKQSSEYLKKYYLA